MDNWEPRERHIKWIPLNRRRLKTCTKLHMAKQFIRDDDHLSSTWTFSLAENKSRSHMKSHLNLMRLQSHHGFSLLKCFAKAIKWSIILCNGDIFKTYELITFLCLYHLQNSKFLLFYCLLYFTPSKATLQNSNCLVIFCLRVYNNIVLAISIKSI